MDIDTENCISTPKVLRSTAKLPETPSLERIGYGTGKCYFNKPII